MEKVETFDSFMTGRFGFLDNMTITFYLLSVGLYTWIIMSRLRGMANKKAYLIKSLPILCVLSISLVLLGDKLLGIWALSTYGSDMPVLSLREVIRIGISPLPEKVDLDLSLIAAWVRFTILAVVAYGIGTLLYFKNKVIPILHAWVQKQEGMATILFLILFGVSLDVVNIYIEKIAEVCGAAIMIAYLSQREDVRKLAHGKQAVESERKHS